MRLTGQPGMTRCGRYGDDAERDCDVACLSNVQEQNLCLLQEQSPSVVEEAGVWPNAWQPVGGDASWTATMNEWGHGCSLGRFSTRVKNHVDLLPSGHSLAAAAVSRTVRWSVGRGYSLGHFPNVFRRHLDLLRPATIWLRSSGESSLECRAWLLSGACSTKCLEHVDN